MQKRNLIISIGRECGSGGHEIGEKLAEFYGIKLYDNNFIDLLAERMHQDPQKLAKMEERLNSGLLPVQRNGFWKRYGSLMNKFTDSDRLYLMEKGLIEKLAEEESFVIVGKAANAILADNPDTFRLYLYASEEFKLPRVKERYHFDTDREALRKMRQVDRQRRNYFNYYSDMVWGSSDAHDFMIDTSLFGIDESIEIITKVVAWKFNSQPAGKVIAMPKAA